MSGFKFFKFEYGKRLWEPCVRSQGRTCCAWPWQILSNSTCDIFWRVGNLSHDDWHMCALYFKSLVNTDLQCLEVSLATVPYTTISYMWRWCRSGGLLEKGSSSSHMQLMSNHFAHLTTYPNFFEIPTLPSFYTRGTKGIFLSTCQTTCQVPGKLFASLLETLAKEPCPQTEVETATLWVFWHLSLWVGSKILAVEAQIF